MQIYTDFPEFSPSYTPDPRTLLAFGEKYRPTGDLWQSYLTYLLITDENPYALSCERAQTLQPGSLQLYALADMSVIRAAFRKKTPFAGPFVPMQADLPADADRTDRKIGRIVSALRAELAEAGSDSAFRSALTRFYQSRGVGKFALCSAFYLSSDGEITPVSHFPSVDFNSLCGMESQKARIIDNLERFLTHRSANHILLYGDAGTGKSTSVKAALNRFAPAGLRMIQIRKEQYARLESLIAVLRSRSYRFALFLDDLSFEDFEVEYKGLKAAIEGGLESPPENLLMIATSNRRHLIRESFGEREGGDDVHRNETISEKVSLSDRFGLQIRFGAPTQQEYFDTVEFLAARRGISLDREPLLDGARKFALLHSGFSGRTAEQYVRSL